MKTKLDPLIFSIGLSHQFVQKFTLYKHSCNFPTASTHNKNRNPIEKNLGKLATNTSIQANHDDDDDVDGHQLCTRTCSCNRPLFFFPHQRKNTEQIFGYSFRRNYTSIKIVGVKYLDVHTTVIKKTCSRETERNH